MNKIQVFPKSIVVFISLALLLPPGIFAEEWQSASEITLPDTQAQSLEPVPSVESDPFPQTLPDNPDTLFFLQAKNPLSPAEEKKPEETGPRGHSDYECERYDFADGLELLRPEYASAAIIRELKAEDLARLVGLPFEVGIVALDGEIILFSSGSEDEIGILPAVKELTGKAFLIAHTHPSIYSDEGPSGEDLNESVSHAGPEYVITQSGVYAYTGAGVLNEGNPYSYEEFIRVLNESVKVSGEAGNSLEARRDLNLFISSQDQYNLASEEEKEIFRMGGTISYTSGLTSANVTSLPGSPLPYFMTGSSAPTTLALNSDGRFKLGYDVTASGSYSGMTISFDNGSTSQTEVQNLSTLTYLIFGLQGSANAVKVQFVDVIGNKDTFTLTNIASSPERFWRIKTSTISSSLDKTRIKQIDLYVNQSTTSSTKRIGTLYINSKGLNVNVPQQPIVTSDVPAVTNLSTLTLSGTKEAQTSVLINDVEVVPRNGSTTWSATVNLAVEGNNFFNIQTKNSIGKLSAANSISVIRDTIAPVIVPEDLPAGNRTDLPYLVIPYLVQDANPQNPEEFATFNLIEGANDLVLTATDRAGNQNQLHVTIQYVAPEANLTNSERALRQGWLETNFPYFTEANGIDSATGFPIDVIGSNAFPGIFWTQPTSIGFYLHLLGNLISKRIVLSSFSQAAALTAAEKTLTSLLDAQTRFGWQGLIPWLRLEGGVRPDTFNQIGLIDNANLTHHLAALVGLLEKGNLQRTIASSIYDKAKTFIDRQGNGYVAFVDPVFGVFRGVYHTDWGTFDGYADRFGSEVRATLPFLIEYFGVPSSVLTGLIRSTSSYPTLQGRTIDMFSTFDGGAFQYFWPLLVAPEESLPQIAGPLQNALLAFSDLTLRKSLPGFLSASSLPEGGYSAKLGINFLKETPDLLDETVASVYALASAYRLNPSWILSKISEIEQNFPLLSGPLGFYDSMRLGGGVSQNYYAIDQGAFLLGLLGTGAEDFRSFFEKRGLWPSYTAHYSNLSLNIPQAVSSLPEPPIVWAEVASRDQDSADLYRSGYDYDGSAGNGIEVSETSQGVFTYRRTQPSGWIGGWVTPSFDRNAYDYVVIEARSLTDGANQVRFELKNYDYFILQQILNLQGTGWHTFQFFFSKDTPPINFAAFAEASTDFEVRTLYFADTPLFQRPVGNSNDLYRSGYDYNGMTGNGIQVSESSPGVYTYTRTASSGWVGGFVTPAFDRNSYSYGVIQIRSLSEGTNQVRLELKNDQSYILKQVLTLEGTGWQTFEFYFPTDTLPINFVAFADATSDFEVRALYFTDTPPSQTPAPSNTPEITQTSSSTATQSHYLLIYTINGFPRSEWVDLVPGENIIHRIFSDSFGQGIAYDFRVTLN